ncbi:MAG: AAA family ATPase [Desulfobulbaceae bacterium]|nr:AAA family ATPase [Desulfobulbaceae bacterium]
MQIKLQSLRIRNFRGIKNFELKPEGKDVLVYGQNGAGKTSCADALNWLLFDKNSAGDQRFGLKPTVNGEELHYLEHEVEAVLNIDGYNQTFVKIMAEKWTKKRGSSSPEFSGHETSYAVNGVPKSLSEFNAIIAAVCPEDVFRMLTSVTHFNERMKWLDRRALLLEIVGNISDADVIAAHPGLADLLTIIPEGRTMDEHRKVLDAQRKKLNEALKTIPARIDEAKRGKPAENSCIPPQGESYADLGAKLAELQNKRSAKLAGDTSELRQRVVDLHREINEADAEHKKAFGATEDEVRKFTVAANGIMSSINMEKNNITATQFIAERVERKIVDLRTEWATVNESTAPGTDCSLCGQALPADKAATILNKFRTEKADRLKSIQKEGKALSDDLAKLKLEMQEAGEKIAALTADHDMAAESARTVQQTKAPDHTARRAEIARIEAQIGQQGTPDTAKIDMEIECVQLLIRLHDEAAAKLKIAAQQDVRVAELTAEQKKYGAELDETDRQIMLCEDFVKAKVGMLESAVSEKFAPLTFKLFEQQINGGIADTCVTMMDGKDYGKLSTGERIVCGVTVINALSRHFGTYCPIFLDNYESLTRELPPIETQTIRLIASNNYEKLTVKSL